MHFGAHREPLFWWLQGNKIIDGRLIPDEDCALLGRMPMRGKQA
jgi:hypothetical protein